MFCVSALNKRYFSNLIMVVCSRKVCRLLLPMSWFLVQVDEDQFLWGDNWRRAQDSWGSRKLAGKVVWLGRSDRSQNNSKVCQCLVTVSAMHFCNAPNPYISIYFHCHMVLICARTEVFKSNIIIEFNQFGKSSIIQIIIEIVNHIHVTSIKQQSLFLYIRLLSTWRGKTTIFSSYLCLLYYVRHSDWV
jgi:hypothetical protein